MGTSARLVSAAYIGIWLSALVYIQHVRTVRTWLGRLGTVMVVTSLGLLTLGLVGRSREAGHWPLTNRYEVALCTLWVILGVYLLLEASLRERKAAPCILGVALLVGTYALTRPFSARQVAPLLPVLRTIWLQLHVLTSVIGYGVFGVAAGLGIMRLVPPLFLAGEGEVQIERTMERVVALGFPWLSLGILTGGIWAQKAWGRYWGWDPKETWTLITWLWYLLILHVRSLRNWRGRRLAGLVVAGFVLVIFTFIGVPWLVRTIRLESLHGF
jgi:ABC-type transport system involved in cytochrome c biogenesis permease subunit